MQGQVRLTLLHTSDIHSRLFPYNLQIGLIDAQLGLGDVDTIANVGGVARISYLLGRERARAGRVLHLDGGDCFQGAPVFNFFSGEAEIRAMSTMGVDAQIVANHEFDRGANNLALQLQQWATYPVLVANYKLQNPAEPGASALGSIVRPFQVFNVDGLKVGVIGMGNLSSLSSIYTQPNRLGVLPLSTAEVAQSYIDLLRPVVDLVVVVTHLGLTVDQEMIEATEGIDIVLGGHNHIVLQPPKRVRDCAKVDENGLHYVNVPAVDSSHPNEVANVRRYCQPRDVVLAHSGAFAKYVGRLDLVVSNQVDDFAEDYQQVYSPHNGFEVVSHDYRLFPVNASVPEDPVMRNRLQPYERGLDLLARLDLLVGYAPDGARRFSATGGDSPLGNMIATGMLLRPGIQTDFSLTNTTGIRADLVPGAVNVEQMYNIFPFDNSISKMQLSGVEIQELFDFVARRSSGRGCTSQVQIAGARVVLDCSVTAPGEDRPGVASAIYIGQAVPPVDCASDAQCPGALIGSCDSATNRCWQPINPNDSYELATSNYLAGGGSGFRVLKRNTTQKNSGVQQRDALRDFIRGGKPCGSDAAGAVSACSVDADCTAALGAGYVCACPETSIEGNQCLSDAAVACTPATSGTPRPGEGACVLSSCRDDVARYHRQVCDHAPSDEIEQECLAALAPCATAGELCKYLACIDASLQNNSDGRVRMVGK